MSPSCCSGKCSVALFFLILSAVPIAYLISLERAVPSTHVISYHSSGFLRECAKWDDVGRRFLVSYMDGGGGIGELFPTKYSDDVLEEVTLVKDADLAGNSSNGFVIDRHRNRLLLAVGDLIGNRYSALVAYDLSTWRRLFLTVLSSHSKEISYADDVAVDAQGSAYVSDAKGGKIWIVDVNGKLVYTIRSPLFTPPRWYNNFVSLNGIVYHPDGFLIVIHTFSGFLFKIDVTNGDISSKVTLIDVSSGSLRFGDGLEFLSPTKIVVAVTTSLWSESDCTQWLNTKPKSSVLYVSFGSYAHVTKKDLVEIAHGILLSKVNFVWVVRPDIVSSDETNPLPEGFETEAGDRGIVIPWCCQMTVLSHESVGGFLTHCGWNSILETIWCEVPVLCFPLLTDQVTNRKLVVDDWEIGINLCEDKSDFGRDEVGRNINRLMCGVSKVKIGRVKMSLEGAVRNSGSSSEMNLGLFIDGLLSKVGLSNGKA